MAASKKKGKAKGKTTRAPVRTNATVAAVFTGTARPRVPAPSPRRAAPAPTRRTTPRTAPRSTARNAARVLQNAEAAQKQTRAWAKRKIATIRQLMSRIAEHSHTMGTLLNELQIRRAHIALGYRSFADMLKGEGLPHKTTAYKYIQVSQAFTAKQLRALGPTRAFALIELTRETEAHDVARVLFENDAVIGDKPVSESSVRDIRRVTAALRVQNTAAAHGDDASQAENEARAAAQRLRAQLRRRGADEAQVEARVRGGRWGVEAWVPTDQVQALQ